MSTMASPISRLAPLVALAMLLVTSAGTAQERPAAPAPAPLAPTPALAPAPAPPRPAPAVSPDYRIGPEDVLAVTVYDESELSGKYAVELDGTFTFPYVGRITAGGLTIREFETSLRQRLADGFFKKPQVAVAVDTYRSRRVFVLGEVKTPGTLQLTGELSLMEAITRVGSLTESASDDVVVVRGGQGAGPATAHSGGIDSGGKEVLQVNLRTMRTGGATTMLQDGDTVFVGRLEPVYVYGQVKNPGSYPVRAGTTVLQALSLAGGGTPMGALNRIRIIRTVNGEKHEYRATLTDIVQPGDTLTVPERFF